MPKILEPISDVVARVKDDTLGNISRHIYRANVKEVDDVNNVIHSAWVIKETSIGVKCWGPINSYNDYRQYGFIELPIQNILNQRSDYDTKKSIYDGKIGAVGMSRYDDKRNFEMVNSGAFNNGNFLPENLHKNIGFVFESHDYQTYVRLVQYTVMVQDPTITSSVQMVPKYLCDFKSVGQLGDIIWPPKSITYAKNNLQLIVDANDVLWGNIYHPIGEPENGVQTYEIYPEIIFTGENDAYDYPLILVRNNYFVRDVSLDNYSKVEQRFKPKSIKDVPIGKRKVELCKFIFKDEPVNGSNRWSPDNPIVGYKVLASGQKIWKDASECSYAFNRGMSRSFLFGLTFNETAEPNPIGVMGFPMFHLSDLEFYMGLMPYIQRIGTTEEYKIQEYGNIFTGLIAIDEDGLCYSTNKIGDEPVGMVVRDLEPIHSLQHVKCKSIVEEIEMYNSSLAPYKLNTALGLNYDPRIASVDFSIFQQAGTCGVISEDDTLYLCGLHCGNGGYKPIAQRKDLSYEINTLLCLYNNQVIFDKYNLGEMTRLKGWQKYFNYNLFYNMMTHNYNVDGTPTPSRVDPLKFYPLTLMYDNLNNDEKLYPDPSSDKSKTFIPAMTQVKKAYIVGDWVFALRKDGTLWITGGNGDFISYMATNRIRTPTENFDVIATVYQEHNNGNNPEEVTEIGLYINYDETNNAFHYNDFSPFTLNSIIEYQKQYPKFDELGNKKPILEGTENFQVFRDYKRDIGRINPFLDPEINNGNKYDYKRGRYNASLIGGGGLYDTGLTWGYPFNTVESPRQKYPNLSYVGPEFNTMKYFTGVDYAKEYYFDLTHVYNYNRINKIRKLHGNFSAISRIYKYDGLYEFENCSDTIEQFWIPCEYPFFSTDESSTISQLESLWLYTQGHVEYEPRFTRVLHNDKITDFWCGMDMMMANFEIQKGETPV